MKTNIIKKYNFRQNNQNYKKILNDFKDMFIDMFQKQINKKPIIDENFSIIIEMLIGYITGVDEIAQNYNLSLSKGLFIYGDTGVGKTQLMRTLRTFTNFIKINQFDFYSSYEIINSIAKDGYNGFDNFLINIYTDLKPKAIYIDDINFFNEQTKFFGNQIDIIEYLIYTRYDYYQKFNVLTHFSSNSDINELKKKYNYKIIDRIFEMCNFIKINGKTKRI